MGTLFLSCPQPQRRRALSHGGLGGLVEVKPLEEVSGNGKSTWPRRARRKPTPIDTDCGVNKKQVQISPVVSPASRIRGTPRTPAALETPMFATADDIPALASPLLSRYNPRSPQCVYFSLPVTPLTFLPQHASEASELPGSLLLPSQGFPQYNPPTTPPRYPVLRRRQTDEASELSSVPGLSISPCSDPEDNEMLVNPFSSPKRKATKLARAVESSLSSSSSLNHPHVNKAITDMKMEELLHCLPDLTLTVINSVWLPAVQAECARMKLLLDDAGAVKLDAHLELKDFGEALRSISIDARSISATYEKAIKSVESLIERDDGGVHEELQMTERDLENAFATIDAKSDIIHQKEQTLQAQQQTINYIVKVLGSFIVDNLPQSMHDLTDEKIQQVMQIINDHGQVDDTDGSPQPARYLRIEESLFESEIESFHNAQNKVSRYHELALEQNTVIKKQSAELDERIGQYERCINTIKERDHEVILLVQHIDKYEKMIADYENGMRVSETTQKVQEKLFRENGDMEWTVKSLTLGYTKELADRDAEIANLRQKLGSAREEVLARKADVKNVLTHNQALLSPQRLPVNVTLRGRIEKDRKVTTKHKTKKAHFPNSRSMTALPFFSSKHESTDVPDEDRHSDKELTTTSVRPVSRMMPRTERPEWTACMPKKSPDLARSDHSFPDLAPRPRLDSLGVVAQYMRSQSANSSISSKPPSPVDTLKDLPEPPRYDSIGNLYQAEPSSRHIPPNHPLIPRAPPLESCAPVDPLQHKRILSNIPEMSVEGTESERGTMSATSSDREIYRKSLDALNLIEFMRESDIRSPRTGRRVVPRAHYESWEYDGEDDGDAVDTGIAQAVVIPGAAGFDSGIGSGIGGTDAHVMRPDEVAREDSPTMSVSEMYHQGQRR